MKIIIGPAIDNTQLLISIMHYHVQSIHNSHSFKEVLYRKHGTNIKRTSITDGCVIIVFVYQLSIVPSINFFVTNIIGFIHNRKNMHRNNSVRSATQRSFLCRIYMVLNLILISTAFCILNDDRPW